MMRLRSEAGGRLGETVGGFLGAWWLDVSKGDVLDAESFYHGVAVSRMSPEGQGGGKYQENNIERNRIVVSWLGQDRRRYL